MYCGQTAGWIKILLGTAVGLGPGHIVLDEDPGKEGQGGYTLLGRMRQNSAQRHVKLFKIMQLHNAAQYYITEQFC